MRVDGIIANDVRAGRLSLRFQDCTFSGLDQRVVALNPSAWLNVQQWAAGFNDSLSLYLWGQPGTGKTHAARCALHAMLDLRGKHPYEISAVKLARMVSEFGDRNRFEEGVVRNASTLLIDDIDKVQWDSRGLSFLWELFDERNEYSRRTIITANVAPKELRRVLGQGSAGNDSIVEATLQRLVPETIVQFEGDSVRALVSKRDGVDN